MAICSPTVTRARRNGTSTDFNQSPLIVFYELTQACDLVCLHCRACAQSAAHPSELTTSQSLGLIDQIAEFPDRPMLVMTGGDPFKREDLFDLVEHARNAGLEVSLTPSATPLVTWSALSRLRDSGISRLAISIDGSDHETHDGNRGVPGSFDRSLEILANARELGLPTQVNTTLTPANFHQIEAMAELLSSQQIVLWSVFFLVPVGRASLAPRLSAEQCELAFARLHRESQRRPFAIKTTEAPHYRRFLIQNREAKASELARDSKRYIPLGVNDGKGIMFVSHSGLIHPSGFLPIVCGIYPQSHVVRVYQDSPIFRGLRDANRLEGKCHFCEFRHVCGGSRARAFAVTGNLYAQEPDCVYLPLRAQAGE